MATLPAVRLQSFRPPFAVTWIKIVWPLSGGHFAPLCQAPQRHVYVSNANLPPDVIDSQMSKVMARTWRDSQVVVTHLWNRWLKEYVTDRIERRRWFDSRKKLARFVILS
jgi:Family of unknown function (DUF5641)